jgi:hypothetical protein
MRHDSIEFPRVGLAVRAAEERVARIATRLTERPTTSPTPAAVEAIDEAFAGFTAAGMRRTRVDQGRCPQPAAIDDQPVANASHPDWEPIKRGIAADLTIQLDALDEQRDRLAKLLRSIEPNSMAH